MSVPSQSVMPADSDAMNEISEANRADFERFAQDSGERLRRVLVAGYGVEVGNDLCADALAYAWEHWGTNHDTRQPRGLPVPGGAIGASPASTVETASATPGGTPPQP